MIHIDLHTHSYASPDGGISLEGYRKALRTRLLSFIAVTDHDSIDAALEINKVLGDRIIVGEEIMSQEGEIIGLYMKETVPSGLTVEKTLAAIKAQDGLVYIPHPFETIRKGISEKTLAGIVKRVDIIETKNGRAVLQNKSSAARAWSELRGIAPASSSDAHNYAGLGRTYTSIPHRPTRDSLVELLTLAAHTSSRPRIIALTAPKVNKLKKALKS